MKYFKNVTSYENMKEQYKNLLKANHPDNGGDVEIMKEINIEYDSIFKIWKDRHNAAATTPEQQTTETAESTRRTFYTAYGWEGSRYDSNLTLKDISKIVRNYVKEKYPTCKFSIRTHYASMYQSLSVDLLEFPERMYKTAEELKDIYYTPFTYTDSEGKEVTTDYISDTIQDLLRKYRINGIFDKDSWTQEEFLNCYTKTVFEENKTFYGATTDYFQSVIDDVNGLIASYNYDDSDGMIDYFDVNFYDGKVDYSECKFVPKTARIKNKESKPATKKAATGTTAEPTAEIESKEDKTMEYKITQGEDSRDGSILWLVRIVNTLSKSEYIEENKKMRDLGGYYSKFRHAFIFRSNPTEALTGKAA